MPKEERQSPLSPLSQGGDPGPGAMRGEWESAERNRPVIGVVIPTYSRVEFLKEAIASILEQSYGEVRVLVMDDASPDGTAEYLATIKDPRFRFMVNGRNLGLAGSINRGIALLPEEANWCTVLCDDDSLDRDYFQTVLAAIDRRGIRDVAYGRIRFIDAKGGTIGDVDALPENESALDYLRSRGAAARETYLSGTLFRRDAFWRIGGYPIFATGMAADEALLFALALPAGLSYVPEARVLIRVHGEAESQQVRGIPAHLKAVREFGDFCRQQAAGRARQDAKFGAELEGVIRQRMRGLNNLLWLRGERFLRKSKDGSKQAGEELATLYQLARDRQSVFSPRIRVDGWIKLFTGISPESIGLYRYFWEKVLKVSAIS
jgi:glycosyltransferase involved in cell wall biosynthesis